MPAISDIEGLPVVGSGGKRLGVVERVLFHPDEPRVVGLMVAVPPLLFLFDRKSRLVALHPGMLKECGEGGTVVYDRPRLPKTNEPTRDLGFTWDKTVIWRNMEVAVPGKGQVGTVSDVRFSRKTLKVLRIHLSAGTLSDLAVGRTEVPGDLVEGFDGAHVIVDRSFVELAPSGGLAAASGKGVAHAKIGAEKAADAAVAAGIAGLEVVERSFKSGWGSKAMKAARKARERAAEAMRADDDD